jgi:hypothetical protein
VSPSPGDLIPTRNGPPPFDFERLTRFAAYGFLMAPVQYQWYGFLARSFPLLKGHSTIPAMKRVAMDQLVFAPVGMQPPLPVVGVDGNANFCQVSPVFLPS